MRLPPCVRLHVLLMRGVSEFGRGGCTHAIIGPSGMKKRSTLWECVYAPPSGGEEANTEKRHHLPQLPFSWDLVNFMVYGNLCTKQRFTRLRHNKCQ